MCLIFHCGFAYVLVLYAKLWSENIKGRDLDVDGRTIFKYVLGKQNVK
jgi:hypothetical protein